MSMAAHILQLTTLEAQFRALSSPTPDLISVPFHSQQDPKDFFFQPVPYMLLLPLLPFLHEQFCLWGNLLLASHLFHLESHPCRLLIRDATGVSETNGPRHPVRPKTLSVLLFKTLPFLVFGLFKPEITSVTSLVAEIFYSATYFSAAVDHAVSVAHSWSPLLFRIPWMSNSSCRFSISTYFFSGLL